jgi:mRNA-degrading endonuclease RelE of RelBE toxin-antitoxin system
MSSDSTSTNPSNHPTVQVRAAPEFQRRLRNLAKKYRRIRTDLQPILDQLQAGELIGDQVPGTGFTVLKLRLKNSDIQRGKSAGYRLIYPVESSTQILLLLIYAKSDQTDVSAAEVKAAISEAEQD